MAIILASGTSEARSTDIVIAAGSSATVFLTDAAGPMVDPDTVAEVQIKSTGGEYFTIGRLCLDNNFALCIQAPGTYAVLRKGCENAVIVEQT